jgi:hypothetical protein
VFVKAISGTSTRSGKLLDSNFFSQQTKLTKTHRGGFAKVKKATRLDNSEEEYAVKIIKMYFLMLRLKNRSALNVDDYLAIGNEVEI